MPTGERLTSQALGQPQLDNFVDTFTRGSLREGMHLFVLYSGRWTPESPPRVDLTNYWNMAFYRSLYPDLQEPDAQNPYLQKADIPNYRILARVDGEAWLTLKELGLEQDASLTDGLNEWLLERADEQVNGASLDKTSEGYPSLAQQRITQGMSRQLRIVSGLVVLKTFNTQPDEAAATMEKLDLFTGTLGLSEAEQQATSQLYLAAGWQAR